MKSMGKSITMRDIAKALEVSTVTVSKALSDKEGVSDEVRAKIKQKAQEMGYRYNSLAKAMKEGSSYNIGILVSEKFFSSNSFYSDLYKKIIMELTRIKYSGILEIISYEDEVELNMPNMVVNNKVDGIILMGQISTGYIEHMDEMGIPYIFLDFYDEHSQIGAIVSDNVYGSYLLTNYLISMGHTQIAFIGNITATSSILDRYLGYYKSLLFHNIEMKKEWLISDRDESGKYINIEFPEEMPTAFVCNCDQVAYHVMEQLKERGYLIPEDISIVGFDDYIYSTICSPQLTTFRVDMEAMGEIAVDAISKKIVNEEYLMGRKVVSGNLIIRESVKRIK
ncbi:LacI family DNA-binding transcriptional regulator [Candidatus Galacturonibacter soehngenii]|nr:LacI family DNA-binding transcriptional regulator [Candidatus Galacturonibacter soehngenii]